MLAAAVLALGLCSAGCLGPNKWWEGLHEWNKTVTDSDVANELIFLGMTIIPVYAVTYLIDIVVLNTIDYWSNGEGE
jgi:hypothetical protein